MCFSWYYILRHLHRVTAPACDSRTSKVCPSLRAWAPFAPSDRHSRRFWITMQRYNIPTALYEFLPHFFQKNVFFSGAGGAVILVILVKMSKWISHVKNGHYYNKYIYIYLIVSKWPIQKWFWPNDHFDHFDHVTISCFELCRAPEGSTTVNTATAVCLKIVWQIFG